MTIKVRKKAREAAAEPGGKPPVKILTVRMPTALYEAAERRRASELNPGTFNKWLCDAVEEKLRR